MKAQKSFEILNLKPGASLEDAKKAYKKLVKFCHPDQFSQNPLQKLEGEERLKEVNLAYEQVKAYLASKQTYKCQTETQHSSKAQNSIKPGRKKDTRTSAQEKAKTDPKYNKEFIEIEKTIRNLWNYCYKNFFQKNFYKAFQEATKFTKDIKEDDKSQNSRQDFRHILKQAQNSAANTKEGNKHRNGQKRTKPGNKKVYTHSQGIGRRNETQNSSGRVEPITRVKPVDRIRGIGKDR